MRMTVQNEGNSVPNCSVLIDSEGARKINDALTKIHDSCNNLGNKKTEVET